MVFRNIRDKGEPMRQDLYTWIPSGTFHVGSTLFVDQLTAVMLIVVTSVGFLVHVYSIGYMHGRPRLLPASSPTCRFFVFSMLMLVLADNFLLLFVCWEGVGLCSYLLIGFWFTAPLGGQRRQEGVHGQPHRRLRLRPRASCWIFCHLRDAQLLGDTVSSPRPRPAPSAAVR